MRCGRAMEPQPAMKNFGPATRTAQ
jgi:hypothetical protein